MCAIWRRFPALSLALLRNISALLSQVLLLQMLLLLMYTNNTPYSELRGIGPKTHLHCKAIELVGGGSPKICVLVERKAMDRVKSELYQPKPVWISCLYSTSVQSWIKSMETISSSHKSLYTFISTRPTRLEEPPLERTKFTPKSAQIWSKFK